MVNDSEYADIYDRFYTKHAKKCKYSPKTSTKVRAIDKIFNSLSFRDTDAIRAGVRYERYPNRIKESLSGIEAKKLNKAFNLASKHMYSPENIKRAVPRFYDMKKSKTKTRLKESDFEDKKYIINALKKSGIEYREQLLRHIELGYYYLWTIPGCGDIAKQVILKAIDNWLIK